MEPVENEGSRRFAPGTMDHVLSEIDSPEIRESILRIAHESGVRQEDPVWMVIRLILEAQDAKTWAGGAAKAAGEAADRIREEIRSLPDQIRESAGAGGEAVEKTVKEAGVLAAGEVRSAGLDVGKALIAAIRKEGGDLEKSLKTAASGKKDEIVGGWLVDLSAAASKHQTAKLWKWVSVGLLAGVLFLVAGASGTWYYMSRQVSEISLSCSALGEKILVYKGQKFCYRILPN